MPATMDNGFPEKVPPEKIHFAPAFGLKQSMTSWRPATAPMGRPWPRALP